MPRAKVTIEFDEGFFDEVLNSPQVRASVDLAAEKVMEVARSTAPVDTGTYRDSIHVEHEQGAHRQIAQVVADAPYSIFVEATTGNLARAAKKVRV